MMHVFPFRHRWSNPDRKTNRPLGRHCWRLLGISAVLLPALLAAGCGEGPPPRQEKEVEVIVTTLITDRVTDYQDFTGRLTAIYTVDIRARVTGYIKSVHFKEGDYVHKGELLFEIDPRPYLADLNQAKANLNLAQADSRLQEKIAQRTEDLYRRRATSREDYETAVATAAKSKATVKSMEAARDRAQLYVDYTHVVSPLDGRISYRNVDPGNLVNADNTVLTTIVTEDPVYVYYDVDERTYVELAQSSTAGQSSWFAKLQFPVLIRLSTEEEFTHVGTADFLDNRVNANTGTIRMRGVFRNPKGYLKSGLFARVRLPVGTPYPALLIPDEALQSDQGRKFVYVVNAKNEVVYRGEPKLELGHAIKGLRVIKKGLDKGERVIITGMQRVRPGTKVKAKMQAPPKRPACALGKLLAAARSKSRKAKSETTRAKSEIPNPKSETNPKSQPGKSQTAIGN
jgi:RND family efflux transporter MFP subunit